MRVHRTWPDFTWLYFAIHAKQGILCIRGIIQTLSFRAKAIRRLKRRINNTRKVLDGSKNKYMPEESRIK